MTSQKKTANNARKTLQDKPANAAPEQVAAQSPPATPRKKGGNQPKNQATKSRAVVKQRRKKIIKAILEGKTHQEAGIIAGLKPENAGSQVSKILQNPPVRNALLEAMEKAGMTDEYLALKHRALIEGTKVISATIVQGPDSSDLKDAGSMSKDFIEVPDNQALAKGLEMMYKLRGKFTEKHEVDIKQPVTIVIRKFCSRGPVDANPGPEGATT